MTDFAPQTPAPAESGPIVRGGSDPFSFDDMAQVPPQAREKKSEPKEKAEPKEKKEPSAKADRGDKSDSSDDESRKRQPAKAESEEKKEPVSKGTKDDKGEEKERKAKPKVHKVRSGESVIDIAGDSLVTVEIDGKKEDVTLEELRSNWSGKVAYDRRFTDLDKREKSHQQTVTKMNDMVNGLMERASKNPEDGLDFLAELTGKDPVELKMQTLRAQIQELLPLAQMTEQERETWLKDRERDFRDRRYERRKEDDEKKVAETKAKEETEALRGRYGVSEAAYDAAREAFKAHTGKDPSPREIIETERYLLGVTTVREVVPHLESRKDFANILEDIAEHLLKNPSMSKEQLSVTLQELWPADTDSGLRKVGRKAKESAEESGESFAKPIAGKKAVFFDDL